MLYKSEISYSDTDGYTITCNVHEAIVCKAFVV